MRRRAGRRVPFDCPLARADGNHDRGSIMLALLGIVILTGVVSVGLAGVVHGQVQTRHDQAFTQALSGAESGLDSMVARIKAAPSAAAQDPISGTNSATGAGYRTSASYSGGTWSIDSIGSAT